MGTWSIAADVVEALLDLVVPRACAGCAVPQQLLCASCRAALDGAPLRTVPRPCPPGFPPTWTTTAYDGVVREVLIAHKEHARLGLARPLGAALALAVAAAIPATSRGTVLVPVPSARSATRQRGHDPMLRTARCAAYALRARGRPSVVLPLLVLSRRVSDQAGLGGAARAVNVAGAHRVRPRLAARVGGGTLLVVVDDLVTTGSSLAEAARALRAAGLPPAAAAVVAATARRDPLDRPGRTV